MIETVITTCGACRQADDHPKHTIYVGVPTTIDGRRLYDEHDFDRNGCVHYHFDCDTPWHDLHAVLPIEPRLGNADPADDWTEEQAEEHRVQADRHARICEIARSGVQGDTLRQRIRNLDIAGGAGGLDQAINVGTLNALNPNSGTKTIGALTITGPIKMRLMTANGSDATAGTELATGSGYTAGGSSVSMGSAANPGTISSNGAVSWTNMPSTTTTGMEQWDSSATPQRTFWGPWTGGNIVVGAGNTFTVASGSLTDTLA